MLLFSIDPECGFASALADALDESLSPHEDRSFEDGEHKLRPLVDPRGADVYVLGSLHGSPRFSPHDRLCRLLMFVATLRDHGAARVTALVPYLAYGRKDRQTQPFDPVAPRYLAQLFEAVRVDQLVVLEAHNLAAFQNAFRCPTLHLAAHLAFDAVVPAWVGDRPLAIASPDPGGVKRAQLWQASLEHRLARPVGFAMVDKRRSAGQVSSCGLVAGQVEGMAVLLIDDLIASGQTLRHAAQALRQAGAREVMACAAHGLFTGQAAEALADPSLARVLVTDSVPDLRLPATAQVRDKLQVVTVAQLFAQAVRACRDAWPQR
jgi:ribose-phosphate pyrophosphokinase